MKGADVGQRITAIIPTGRNSRHIATTIHALVNQTLPLDQIIIGDQSEKGILEDEFIGWLCHLHDIDVVRIARNGRAFNRNELAKLARNELVLSVDDDAALMKDCTKHLLKSMRSMGVAIVAPKVIDVLPANYGFGYRDFVKNARGTKDRRALALRGTAWLFQRQAWLNMILVHDGKDKGFRFREHVLNIKRCEDIFFSMLIGQLHGAGVSGKALAIHHRQTPFPYQDEPVGREWLEENIAPFIGNEYYKKWYGFKVINHKPDRE